MPFVPTRRAPAAGHFIARPTTLRPTSATATSPTLPQRKTVRRLRLNPALEAGLLWRSKGYLLTPFVGRGETVGVDLNRIGSDMPELTRSQFCELTKLPPETMKTMDRRLQLPFSIDQTTWGRRYSLFEAFLMITAQEFSEGHAVNLNRAADITAALPDVLAPKWAHIVETADRMTAGTGQRVEEVMCGRYYVAGIEPPRAVAGTNAEIEVELAGSAEPVIRSILSSASRSLALLYRRCVRQSIEIPGPFVSGPFTYRPRIDAVALGRNVMQKLIDEGAHLHGSDG